MPESVSPLFNDATIRSLKLTMEASAARHNALASNIANVSTPGYKRMDLDPAYQTSFERTLQQIQEGQTVPFATKPVIAEDKTASKGDLDGNNVNLDHELPELMKNSTNFEFASRLLAKQYNAIHTAITGRSV